MFCHNFAVKELSPQHKLLLLVLIVIQLLLNFSTLLVMAMMPRERGELNTLLLKNSSHDFCITQILREINFEDSRSAKSAILTQALTFDFFISVLFEGF